jgi:hypothetical protein
MKTKRVLRFLLPALVVAFAMGCGDSAPPAPDAGANAAKDSAGKKGGDKKIGSKKGVEGSLGTKEIEEEKLPGTLEIGLALGSTVAMIACFKYL